MKEEYEHKMIQGDKGHRVTMLSGKHRGAKSEAIKRSKETKYPTKETNGEWVSKGHWIGKNSRGGKFESGHSSRDYS